MTTVASNRAFNAALFTEATRNRNFTNLMTEGAPKKAKGGKGTSAQTSSHMPIVRVTDLTKVAGNEVEVDVVHQLAGSPTMGDRKLEGRGESMTTASMDMKIDQGRHLVNAGGKMAQQRTKHKLEGIARTLLSDNYFSRLTDETTLYHLAGARGSLLDSDMIVPLASHDEFSEIVVNPLAPPTYDRHYFANDEAGLDALDSSDVFSLGDVERVRLGIDEMPSMRMQPIKYKDDVLADEDPLYVQYLTPRQFYDFKQTTSHKDLQTLMSNAMRRTSGFRHPLFMGDCFLWEGILIKKMPGKFVEFAAGHVVDVSTNTNNAQVTTVTPTVKVHRSIVLGGQALAHAFGNSGTVDGPDAGFIGMTKENTDHDNSTEISIRWMDGKKKIRFADKNGRVNDHGVIVLDTAVSG